MKVAANQIRNYRLHVHHLDRKIPIEDMLTAAGVCGLLFAALVEEVAERNIQGEVDVEAAFEIIHRHYDEISNPEFEAQEADMATVNIVRLLTHAGFILSSAALQTIHREIFADIPLHGNPDVAWAGVYRTDDRQKDESILNGRSVRYSSHMYIKDHSVYFRNALVRASFFDNKLDIRRNTRFLELFLDNLLFDARHDLNILDLKCHELFQN